MEFTDNVSEALANGGKIDLDDLVWTREPASYTIDGDTVSITTAPHTDLWQRGDKQRMVRLGDNCYSS